MGASQAWPHMPPSPPPGMCGRARTPPAEFGAGLLKEGRVTPSLRAFLSSLSPTAPVHHPRTGWRSARPTAGAPCLVAVSVEIGLHAPALVILRRGPRYSRAPSPCVVTPRPQCTKAHCRAPQAPGALLRPSPPDQLSRVCPRLLAMITPPSAQTWTCPHCLPVTLMLCELGTEGSAASYRQRTPLGHTNEVL